MPVALCQGDTTKVLLDKGDGVVWELTYLGLPGQSGSNNHRNGLIDGLNALLEIRVNMDDVAADDPDKTATDEELLATYGERMYKEKVGPNTFLVSRSAIISGAVWDGEKYIMSVRKPKGP